MTPETDAPKAASTHRLGMPWVSLGIFPTPLQPASRLSAATGREIWFKRDDLAGFGVGGNKVRALEFLMGQALVAGADCLVTGAGPQSNWAMLAALAARVHGLDPFLVFYGDPPDQVEGNLKLHDYARSDIRFTNNPHRESVDDALVRLTEALVRQGRKPITFPRGGATAVGALGYVAACAELNAQYSALDLVPTETWVATGSCCTQAGLVAGQLRFGLPGRIRGVSVSRPPAECCARIAALANGVSAGSRSHAEIRAEDVLVEDFIGPGYGKPSVGGREAARVVAEHEGVFLDAAFGAKAMAALLASPPQADPVVFVVTGGVPTLFQSEMVSM